MWKPLLFFFLQNALVPSCAQVCYLVITPSHPSLQNALVPSCSQAMLFFTVDELGFSQRFLAAQGVLAFLCLLLGTVLYSRAVQVRLTLDP